MVEECVVANLDSGENYNISHLTLFGKISLKFSKELSI